MWFVWVAVRAFSAFWTPEFDHIFRAGLQNMQFGEQFVDFLFSICGRLFDFYYTLFEFLWITLVFNKTLVQAALPLLDFTIFGLKCAMTKIITYQIWKNIRIFLYLKLNKTVLKNCVSNYKCAHLFEFSSMITMEDIIKDPNSKQIN